MGKGRSGGLGLRKAHIGHFCTESNIEARPSGERVWAGARPGSIFTQSAHLLLQRDYLLIQQPEKEKKWR